MSFPQQINPRITIVPYDLVTTNTVTSFEVFILGIVLGVNARIGVKLMNNTGTPVDSRQLMLEGEEYQAWGTDDDYIYNWVCQKLNLTRYTPEPTTNTEQESKTTEPQSS